MTKQYEYHRTYANRPENAIKRAAHEACKAALSKGEMVRKPCEACGTEPAEAHHDDYSKPLAVRWLCRKHHAEHHALERKRHGSKYNSRPLLSHCKRGHALTPENILNNSDGKRRCRTCRRWRARRNYLRRKAA